MHDMKPTGGTLVGSYSGNTFRVEEVGVVCFCVSGLSGGTITIEAQPYTGGAWETLDATNLVWSATDGFAYAVIGSVNIRATSASATTGGTLFVGIAGNNVFLDS